MELFISPARIAEYAFRAPNFINAAAISDATILAAQQKFIRPALGPLYDEICAGRYPDFLEEYIQPPLALYVKLLMMPSLAVQAGGGGVAEASSENLTKAGDSKFRYAVRRLRSDAAALMDRAAAHLDANRESFPEYEPRADVRRRRSIEGGVIL